MARRADPFELGQRRLRVRDRDLRFAALEPARELHPRERGVEGHPLLAEGVHRRLELRPGHVVAAGRRDLPRGERRRRLDPRELRAGRDRREALRRRGRARRVFRGELNVDEEREVRCGQHGVGADPVEPSVDHGGGHGRLATSEVQGGEGVRRLGELLVAGQQLLGLLGPTLQQAQLRQFRGRMDAPRPLLARLQDPDPLREQALGLAPLTRRQEHLGAARVTEAHDRRVLVLPDPRLDDLPPPLDPLPVPRQLEGRDRGARHVADRLELCDLAAGGGRHRLVELRGPGDDLARGHLRVPHLGERLGLEVGITERAGHVEGLRRGGEDPVGGPLALRTGEREPAPLDARPLVSQEPLGAGLPAGARRLVPVRGGVLPRQPDRRRSGAAPFPVRAERRVGPLELRQGAGDVLQPPSRSPEPGVE